jgi:hypothetical protein
MIILDMVRSMIKNKEIPKEFWAEVVQYAVYIQNRWSHIFLNVAHIKVFERIAYGKILDPKTKERSMSLLDTVRNPRHTNSMIRSRRIL